MSRPTDVDAVSSPSGVGPRQGLTAPVATRGATRMARGNQERGTSVGAPTGVPAPHQIAAGYSSVPGATRGCGSFQAAPPRLPKGYEAKFCRPCNARGRVHINGRCVVCRDAALPRTTKRGPRALPLIQFLWDRITRMPNGCWEYRNRNAHGYGKVNTSSALGAYAHRVMYELYVGAIPDELELDHLCQNPACCNPAHLEAVTHSENARRVGLRRTHCKWGHEFTPENTYLRPDTGTKQCRKCISERRTGRRDYGSKQ